MTVKSKKKPAKKPTETKIASKSSNGTKSTSTASNYGNSTTCKFFIFFSKFILKDVSGTQKPTGKSGKAARKIELIAEEGDTSLKSMWKSRDTQTRKYIGYLLIFFS